MITPETFIVFWCHKRFYKWHTFLYINVKTFLENERDKFSCLKRFSLAETFLTLWFALCNLSIVYSLKTLLSSSNRILETNSFNFFEDHKNNP